MHVLLRGGLLQRLRLASGLVLFAFAGAHFLNHATGLVSLELMHQIEEVRTTVTRSVAGTLLLMAALATHISLGLYKLAMRRTLKLPLWEALQILVALCIPFLLFPHIVNTRIAHVFFGVNDTYLYELARLWPERAVLQSLLLLLVWAHGCIGLHYWLRLSDGYSTFRPALWIVAALVPMLALGGFISSGTLTAGIMADPDSLTELKTRSHWPNAADGETLARIRDTSQYAFGATIGIVGAILALRHASRRRRRRIAITYTDGPTVNAVPGSTLLELSRASGIPHGSLCGGRARCSTCCIKIESATGALPAPNAAEDVALRALDAPEDIRLACQLRPTSPMTITILDRLAAARPGQVEFTELQAFVAAHVRAALAGQMIDHPGDDPDSLTRWLAERVSYSFKVPVFANDRFALRGARVDYLAKQEIATVVLQHGVAWISLFILPGGGPEAIRGSHRGHSVLGWEDVPASYLAVSDIGTEVLEKLQDALSAANGLAAFGDHIDARDPRQPALGP